MLWFQLVSASDCTDLVDFARYLGKAISSSCCTVAGVTCVGTSVVSVIWSNMGLSGYIIESYYPSGLVHLDLSHNDIYSYITGFPDGLTFLNLNSNQISEIDSYPSGLLHLDLGSNPSLNSLPLSGTPASVTYVDLSNVGYWNGKSIGSFSPNRLHIDYSGNSITGTIPTLPPGLKFFDMSNNKLNGPLPLLPQNLTHFDVHDNSLTSSLPSQFPPGLTYLDVQTNQLTGTIPLLSSGLIDVSFNDNQINGQIPAPLPVSLRSLYLAGNKMMGDVPILPPTLQYLLLGYPGYPGNRFTGSVAISKPIKLFINTNYIADVIVYDGTLLTTGNCDLSNNPLLGNSNIVSLTMCLKNGLYSAAALPVTISLSKTTLQTAISSTTATLVFGSSTILGKTTSKLNSLYYSSSMSTTSSFPFILISSSNTLKCNTCTTQINKFASVSENESIGNLQPSATFYIESEYASLKLNSDLPLTAVISSSLYSIKYTTTNIKRKVTTFKSPISTPTTTAQESIPMDVNIIYVLIGSIVVIFVVLMLLLQYVKKHSKQSHSRFGRKNSFGTLNSIQTKDTARTK